MEIFIYKPLSQFLSCLKLLGGGWKGSAIVFPRYISADCRFAKIDHEAEFHLAVLFSNGGFSQSIYDFFSLKW